MTSQPLQSRARGFTLIELLVTVAILAVGALGIATMMTRSALEDSRAYYAAQASMLAEAYMENATKSQFSKTLFATLNSTSVTTTVDGVTYAMTCTVSSDTPLTGCREMLCTVQWNTRGFPASIQSTYVYSQKY